MSVNTWCYIEIPSYTYEDKIDEILDMNRGELLKDMFIGENYDTRNKYFKSVQEWVKIVFCRMAVGTDAFVASLSETICCQAILAEVSLLASKLREELYSLLDEILDGEDYVVKVIGRTEDNKYLYAYKIKKEPGENALC